jgi:hypothetical protein
MAKENSDLINKSRLFFINVCKGKAIQLQALAGPEGSRRLPDLLTVGI